MSVKEKLIELNNINSDIRKECEKVIKHVQKIQKESNDIVKCFNTLSPTDVLRKYAFIYEYLHKLNAHLINQNCSFELLFYELIDKKCLPDTFISDNVDQSVNNHQEINYPADIFYSQANSSEFNVIDVNDEVSLFNNSVYTSSRLPLTQNGNLEYSNKTFSLSPKSHSSTIELENVIVKEKMNQSIDKKSEQQNNSSIQNSTPANNFNVNVTETSEKNLLIISNSVVTEDIKNSFPNLTLDVCPGNTNSTSSFLVEDNSVVLKEENKNTENEINITLTNIENESLLQCDNSIEKEKNLIIEKIDSSPMNIECKVNLPQNVSSINSDNTFPSFVQNNSFTEVSLHNKDEYMENSLLINNSVQEKNNFSNPSLTQNFNKEKSNKISLLFSKLTEEERKEKLKIKKYYLDKLYLEDELTNKSESYSDIESTKLASSDNYTSESTSDLSSIISGKSASNTKKKEKKHLNVQAKEFIPNKNKNKMVSHKNSMTNSNNYEYLSSTSTVSSNHSFHNENEFENNENINKLTVDQTLSKILLNNENFTRKYSTKSAIKANKTSIIGMSCYVSYVQSPNDIYIQLENDERINQILSLPISDLDSNFQTFTSKNDAKLNIEKYCIYELDIFCRYRCEIVNWLSNDNDTVILRNIDSGEILEVHLKQIKKINEIYFTEIPPLALKCELTSIEIQDDLPKEIIIILKELLLNQNLIITFIDIIGKSIKIDFQSAEIESVATLINKLLLNVDCNLQNSEMFFKHDENVMDTLIKDKSDNEESRAVNQFSDKKNANINDVKSNVVISSIVIKEEDLLNDFVFVSHVRSLQEFYIQIKLTNYLESYQKKYSLESVQSSQIFYNKSDAQKEIENYCLCYFKSNWHIALVTNWMLEVNDIIEVQLVNIGKVCNTYLKNIRKVSTNLFENSNSVIKCELALVSPEDNDKERNDIFKELVLNKVFKISSCYIESDRIIIDLQSKEINSVAETISNLESNKNISIHEKDEEFDDTELIMDLPPLNIELLEGAPPKENDVCYVTSVNNPFDFYIQIEITDNTLDLTEKSLIDWAKNLKVFTNKVIAFNEIPNYCICYFSKSSSIWRAQIVNWLFEFENIVLVRNIDTGELLEVSLKCIRKVDMVLKNIFEIPALAHKCSLAWIVPISKNQKWTKKAKCYFEELIFKKKFIISYVEPQGNYFIVDLKNDEIDSVSDTMVARNYGKTTEFEKSIWCNDFMKNQILKSQGFVNEDFMKSDAEKLDDMIMHNEEVNPLKAIFPYNYEDEKQICNIFFIYGHCSKKNCTLSHTPLNPDGLTTDTEHVFYDSFNKIVLPVSGSEISVQILNIVNYCTFYVALQEQPLCENLCGVPIYNIRSLCRIMNSPSEISTYKPLSVLPALGEVILVKDFGNRWHRARVLSVEEYGLKVEIEVFLVDCGKTLSLDMKDCRKMKEKFMYIPFQAVRLSLCDVTIAKDISEEIDNHTINFMEAQIENKILNAQIVSSSSYLNAFLFLKNGEDVAQHLLKVGAVKPAPIFLFDENHRMLLD